MTEYNLQDALVSELKELFSEFRLKNAKGEDVSLNIYPQHLPDKNGSKTSEYFPYILVVFDSCEEKEEDEARETKIVLVIGVVDIDDNYQGYKELMNVKEKIYQHLMTKRVLDNKYKITYPIKWELPEEDFSPFYFIGIETNWEIPKVSMPDDEYV